MVNVNEQRAMTLEGMVGCGPLRHYGTKQCNQVS